MKGKIAKVFGVGLALTLVLSLSLVMAAPVSAATAVSTPTVTVSPTTQGLNAKYTIEFNVTTDLAETEYIIVDFTSNADAEIPVYGTFESSDVTVNGHMVPSADFSDPSDVVAVKFLTPVDIAAGGSVTVIFEKVAGISNPAAAASCTLTVCTESDTTATTSAAYIISGYSGKGVNLYNASGVFVNSYETITAAEAAAAASYTIEVEPGTYDEDVTINAAAGITLESRDGPGTTIILGEMTIAGAADNFTVGGAEGKGFTFNGDTTNTELISVSPDADPDADNVTISYNVFESRTGMTTTEAIFVVNTCTGLTVTENSFTLHNLYDMGIATHPSHLVSRFTITNNTFTGAGNTVDHSGIELKQFTIASTDTTISGNTFSDFYVGLMIGSDQAGAGMVTGADGTGVLNIKGNTFDECRYGLDIVNALADADDEQNLVVVGNTFSNCTYGAAIDYGPCPEGTDYLEPADFTVKFNNFSGNSLYALYNNKNEAVDVGLNYWGDTTGPSGAGSGSGDAISTYVTPYIPCLGASISAADYTPSASTLHRQTTVGVDVTSSDTATTIGVAHYTSNPQGTPEFTPVDGGYFDVYATATTWTGDLVTIKLYADGVTSSSKAYFWNDGEGKWVECYDSGASSGYVWVKVREYSATYPDRVPVLTDLVNLPFAIGGEEPDEFDVYELYDANENGDISKSEALTAVVDYFDGVITKNQALEVIVEYMG